MSDASSPLSTMTPAADARTVRIDFVSDVACPWCAIGLHALEQALARVAPAITAEIHLQPFELNPDMAPEGEDITAHLGRKYGRTPEQLAQVQEGIRARGEMLGFEFRQGARSRIWNTFDAHRLLAWAETVGTPGAAVALKHQLFTAYFTDGLNPGAHDVLVARAQTAGLDPAEAAAVLASDRYAADVREREAFWREQGISSVPAVILNLRMLVSGGQPPEAFEQALREAARLGLPEQD